jgi:fucose permease
VTLDKQAAEGGQVQLSRRSAFTGYVLFALIGAVSASYGSIVASFRDTFHVSAATAALLLSGHFAGAVLGVLSPALIPLKYQAPRRTTAISMCLLAVGCLAVGAAPYWQVAVGGALLEGAGWGTLVIIFNTLFATGFGRRSASILLLLNALFGVGSIIGPASVGLILQGHYRPPYLTVAVLAITLLPLAYTLPNTTPSSAAGDEEVRLRTGIPRLLAVFAAAFFLMGGLEGGITAWEPTHLIYTGLSAASAATVASFFSVGYTLGRLVTATLSLRVGPERIVLAALVATGVLLALTRITLITALAYTLCGFAISPLFPLALIWASKALQMSPRTTSLVVAADLFGGVILNAALGRLIASTSAASLPFAFAVMAALCLCILLAVPAVARAATPAA